MNDLSLKTYADALKGGKSGPAIVPNDPAKSMLVQIQQQGGHPGQLSADELAQVMAWIKAGAPETGGVAVPIATPTAPAPLSWSDFQPAFDLKCGTCHVQTQLGGLSLKTYAGALKGGKSGPAIVPNDPDKSVLVQIQRTGKHPNLLSPQEFDALLAWINAGAPETVSATPTPAPASAPSATESWTSGIDQIFNAKCAACHIQLQSGGLSLKSYADALKGGQDGPVIAPNAPDTSLLVQIQQKGGHPGQLSPDELNRVIAWIKAGAPEASGGASSSAPTPAAATPAKWSDFTATLNMKCGTCHVKVQLGGLSFKTYADVLKGGQSGPAVVPGNPDKSVLVQVMQAGDHANVLSAEELAAIIAWIKSGAPEK